MKINKHISTKLVQLPREPCVLSDADVPIPPTPPTTGVRLLSRLLKKLANTPSEAPGPGPPVVPAAPPTAEGG